MRGVGSTRDRDLSARGPTCNRSIAATGQRLVKCSTSCAHTGLGILTCRGPYYTRRTAHTNSRNSCAKHNLSCKCNVGLFVVVVFACSATPCQDTNRPAAKQTAHKILWCGRVGCAMLWCARQSANSAWHRPAHAKQWRCCTAPYTKQSINGSA